MKKWTKRVFVLRCLSIFLIMTAIMLLTGTLRASAAEKKELLYQIMVNRYHNTVTIYEMDEKGKYTIPIKAMVCSVGTYSKTIQGTFQTKEKYRWKALMGDVWGQYATRIVGGILFHSVYYYENNNPASLATAEFNKLGSSASHGCIRLTVEDAKWIYDNCISGTTVIIYDDKASPGPLGKPETIKIGKSVRWDPTDPDEKNPYILRLPKISGVKDMAVAWGEKVDLMKGVIAKSSVGIDITSMIEIEGEVNSYTAGDYKITYSVVDEFGRLKMKAATITVLECQEAPNLIGISDKIVNDEDEINRDFVMTGIKAYYRGKKISQDLVKATFEKVTMDEYYITYQMELGEKFTVTEHASIYIDQEAPTFTGITDKPLLAGQVPAEDEVLANISVADNYSSLDRSDIVVTISKTDEGNYLITFTATDEAGNIASAQASYYYDLNLSSTIE